jgi:hypothetical protein
MSNVMNLKISRTLDIPRENLELILMEWAQKKGIFPKSVLIFDNGTSVIARLVLQDDSVLVK